MPRNPFPGTASRKRELLRRTRDPRSLAAPGPLPRLLKLSLSAEILRAYGTTRWQMTKRDIRQAVAASRARLDPAVPAPPLQPQTWGSAIRLAHAVDRTLSILPTDSRCLVQAVVLSRLLSRRGIASRIVIGVHSHDSFAAHAWVEYAGQAVQSPAGFENSRLLEL